MTALRKTPKFNVTAPAFCASARVGSDGPLQRDEDVGEVDAADEQTYQRGENVFHQAVDDGGEGDPDDDTDRQIDHVAAHYESFELVDPPGPADTEWYCSSFAHDESPPVFCFNTPDVVGE